jgi:hypothetical protein
MNGMNGWTDLDRIDRVTLRTWRAANLIGWWLVGAAIYNVGAIVLARRLDYRLGTAADWRAMVARMLPFIFAATTAGWVVGRHVYRAPRIVAAATILLPAGLFLFRSLVLIRLGPSTPIEVVLLLLYWAIPVALTVVAARLAWGRRPSALRAMGETR